jgi:hypothetical protein
MEDLTVWVAERASKMPREHKFTVGDKWLESCLEVTTLLTEATYVRDKLALLQQASRGLTRARVLARIAERLHLVSTTQLRFFDGTSLEVGKMLGGWTKYARAR